MAEKPELIIPESEWGNESVSIGYGAGRILLERRPGEPRMWSLRTVHGQVMGFASEEDMIMLTNWLNARVARYAEIPPETAPGPEEA